MKFIAMKTDDGRKKGQIAFFCRMLDVSREGFRKYLRNRNRPWKYEALANELSEIIAIDVCNDTYGRLRMYQALILRNTPGLDIPGERTVYRVMNEIGIVHRPKRKPNGITKSDRNVRK